jgi:hypothetical protein
LDFLTLEDGTDTFPRNVDKGLPLDAALCPRRAQISSTSRRKPEITDKGKVVLVHGMKAYRVEVELH